MCLCNLSFCLNHISITLKLPFVFFLKAVRFKCKHAEHITSTFASTPFLIHSWFIRQHFCLPHPMTLFLFERAGEVIPFLFSPRRSYACELSAAYYAIGQARTDDRQWYMISIPYCNRFLGCLTYGVL